MRRFTFIDLFAGIGGFHHALAGLGGECELAVEFDPHCRTVYRAAFPTTPIRNDIRELTRTAALPDAPARPRDDLLRDVPAHNVLCAGFPCQPFSKSGAQQGLRDRTRGTLFFDVMTIVLARRPDVVILENVRNLAGPRHEDTWRAIVDSFNEANYDVTTDPWILSPHLFAPHLGGAPQVRERVFIVARNRELGLSEPKLGDLNGVVRDPDWDPASWQIASYLDELSAADERRYRVRDDESGWIDAWQAFCEEIPSDWLPGFPIWADEFVVKPRCSDKNPAWKNDFLLKNSAFYVEHKRVIDRWLSRRWGPLKQCVAEFPASRRKFEWQARSAQARRADRDLRKLVLHMRPSGIRVKPPTYLPALVAISQTSVVGPDVHGGSSWRRITPGEAARLQGMPSDIFARAGVDDAVAYRQLGNAVNVGIVRYVAEAAFGDLYCATESALVAAGR